MAQMFPVPPKKKVKKRRKPPIAGPPKDVLTAGDTGDNPFAKKGPPKASAKGPKPPLGSGQRFAQVAASAAASGARNPNAVAAVAGRKKFGAAKMNQLAAKGKPGY